MLAALLMLQVWGTLLTTAYLLVAGEPDWSVEGVLWGVGAGTIGIAGLGCMFLALSRSAMGLVSPLSALLGAVIPATIGIVSGDPITLTLAAGMAVALVAIVMISLPDGTVGKAVGPAFHGAKPVDWLLILGSGMGAAGFYLCTDQAHQVGLGTAGTLISIRLTSFAWMLLVVAGVWLRSLRSPLRPPVRVPRGAIRLGLVASVGDLSGTVAYLAATAVGTLSVTVVLVSLFPVSTALLARAVLHERLSRVRVLGVGMAVAGAALIGLGEVAAG